MCKNKSEFTTVEVHDQQMCNNRRILQNQQLEIFREARNAIYMVMAVVFVCMNFSVLAYYMTQNDGETGFNSNTIRKIRIRRTRTFGFPEENQGFRAFEG